MTHEPLYFFHPDTATADGATGTAQDTSADSLISGVDSSQRAPSPQQQGASATSRGFVGEDGAFSEGWLDRLPGELADAKPTLGKYRNITDLAKAHYSLQQLMGKKAQAVLVPNEKSSPREIAEYRKAVGVPESVEEYDFKPEQLPHGMEWQPELAKPYAEIGHKYNIPPAAMREIASLYANNESRRHEISEQLIGEQTQLKKQEGLSALRRAWGDSFEQNLDIAARTANNVGADVNSPGFSDPQVVKAFARLGAMLSEDRMVNHGGPGVTNLSGHARAKDIQTNPQNPYYQRYQDGDPEVAQMVRGFLRG